MEVDSAIAQFSLGEWHNLASPKTLAARWVGSVIAVNLVLRVFL